MATPPTFVTGQVLTAAQMNTIGMHLVKVQTVGTAVSSVTVTNAFSADYDNYRVVVSGVVNTLAANFTVQLSAITGNNYFTAGTFFNFGSAVVNGYGPAVTTGWLGGPLGTVASEMVFDVTNPMLAKAKGYFLQGVSTLAYYSFGGTCTSTSTSANLTIAANSGTMTGGTIRIYGYRNS